jgi:hypothetical protein
MRVVRFLRDHPCASLLLAQTIAVIAYPFIGESEVAGRSVLAGLGLVVLALAIRAVRATPFLWWVAILLAVPALLLLSAQVVTGNDDLIPWTAAFEAPLYFYAAAGMLGYMLRDEHVHSDELFAVGTVFTLLAWGFAYVYVVIDALVPGSFAATAGQDGTRTWMELLYLSVTVLSGMGLSDIVPVDGHARSVVMIEQVCGLFYIAMVVTWLLTLKTRREAARATAAAEQPRD